MVKLKSISYLITIISAQEYYEAGQDVSDSVRNADNDYYEDYSDDYNAYGEEEYDKAMEGLDLENDLGYEDAYTAMMKDLYDGNAQFDELEEGYRSADGYSDINFDAELQPGEQNYGALLNYLIDIEEADTSSIYRSTDSSAVQIFYEATYRKQAQKAKKKKKTTKVKRKKKKVKEIHEVHQVKNDIIDLSLGGASAFRGGMIPFDMQSPNNCKRGWHADDKICGNTCRVKWLAGNPVKNFALDEEKFYLENRQFSKCEACVIWAGFLDKVRNKPGYFQKTLSFLKAGAPKFCDVENEPDCKKKEHEFAACMGMDVCAEDCWSDNASKTRCLQCKHKYCTDDDDDKHEIKNQFYNICNGFERCYKKFNPMRYPKASNGIKKAGQNCWGKPLGIAKFSEDVSEFLSDADVCKKVQAAKAMPYPEWMKFWSKCKKMKCDDSTHDFYDPADCQAHRCQRRCLNGYGVSTGCIECKYGATWNGRATDCKHDRYCQSAVYLQMCHQDCAKFAKYRAIDIHHANFTLYLNHCLNPNCAQIAGFCAQCITAAEKQGQRVYTSALGENSFRDNYVGWGCLKLCETKNIYNIANRDYANTPADVRAAQWSANMGVIDDKVMETLIQGVKDGH